MRSSNSLDILYCLYAPIHMVTLDWLSNFHQPMNEVTWQHKQPLGFKPRDYETGLVNLTMYFCYIMVCLGSLKSGCQRRNL